MCGRFSLAKSKEVLQQQLPFVTVTEPVTASYNIAPTQTAYVVPNDRPGQLTLMQWGLVPHWSNDGKNSGRLINARREGIEGTPSFRVPIRQRRCLVPADSFYEWRNEPGLKMPYKIFRKDGNLLMFAGLWDVWAEGSETPPLETFCIITTAPNLEMSDIHTRMPVVLTTKEEQKSWLFAPDVVDALALLRTPPDGLLAMHRVSERVNSVANNSADLHEPVPEPLRLFG